MVASQTRRLSAEPSAIAHGHRWQRQPNWIRLNTAGWQVQGAMDLLVIAASTGGPVAIQRVLSQIPASVKFRCYWCSTCRRISPKALPKDSINFAIYKSGKPRMAISCRAASHYWDLVDANANQKQWPDGSRFAIRAKRSGEIYSPCIDITFTSLAEDILGRILAVVLTGMGADGKEGAIRLKSKGAEIWAQDEASSTIYGMPKSYCRSEYCRQNL